MSDAVAALDCGSNSTRLLIVDSSNATLRREMRITRLSEGVDASQTLIPQALERTYDVLREYRTFMDAAGVSRGLLVATSAVRDARNGAEFLAQAGRLTRVEARVLSGGEEATFTYDGATSDLAQDPRPTVVLDIGGGSTELAMKVDGALLSYSMQLGCVRVTERALGRGIVTRERERAANEMIGEQLDAAFAHVSALASVVGHVRLVGVAGTVATLTQLDAGIDVYDRDVVHHRTVSRAIVQQWRDRLSAEEPATRLTHAGMVHGREDVLHSGLYVLDAVMERLGTDELISSENDILDGVAASLLRV